MIVFFFHFIHLLTLSSIITILNEMTTLLKSSFLFLSALLLQPAQRDKFTTLHLTPLNLQEYRIHTDSHQHRNQNQRHILYLVPSTQLASRPSMEQPIFQTSDERVKRDTEIGPRRSRDVSEQAFAFSGAGPTLSKWTRDTTPSAPGTGRKPDAFSSDSGLTRRGGLTAAEKAGAQA